MLRLTQIDLLPETYNIDQSFFFYFFFNLISLSLSPDPAFKMRKNLIRSKPQSCSLYGTLILSVLQGCKIEVLNGPI